MSVMLLWSFRRNVLTRICVTKSAQEEKSFRAGPYDLRVYLCRTFWDLAAERGGSLDIGRNARTRRNALKQVGCVEAGWLLLSYRLQNCMRRDRFREQKSSKNVKAVQQNSAGFVRCHSSSIHPSMDEQQAAGPVAANR